MRLKVCEDRRALKSGRGVYLGPFVFHFAITGRRSPHQIRAQVKAAAPPTPPRSAIWPSPNLDPTSIPKMPDATMPDTHCITVFINIAIFIRLRP
jgi:hypothetical protein